MGLPKFGLQGVFEDKSLSKGLDAANKKITAHTAKVKTAAEQATSGMKKVSASVDGLKNKVAQMVGVNAQATSGILELTGALGPMAVAVGVAVIGIGALVAGLIALGNRGAPLIGLGESFDRLTASVGLSSEALLVDLRKAANGTVSDFDLIRRANLALVGSTGEFGKQFGQKLPQVLAAARAAARATGQDVDFLFNSLVSGIKRASPRLIDNTGIVLKLSEANETLAKQLGKSVDQLTLEEKQIAVLNATVVAGQALVDQLNTSPKLVASFEKQRAEIEKRKELSLASIEELRAAGEITAEQFAAKQAEITGQFAQRQEELVQKQTEAMAAYALEHETAAEKIARAQATLTNIFDGLAIAVQPAFAAILDVVNNVLGGIQDFVRKAAPFINFAAKMIGDLIKGIGNALFGEGGIGQRLGQGAYDAFKSFAAGISFAANKLIFPAIIAIAKFIADLLIGLSPPPKGPLSMIDKGGENVMLAWLDGLTGVSLDPVSKVAEEVSLALGAIGKATLPVVNARLAELDKALLPFQQRLDIVKSQFEAISAPAQAALEAIDRQLAAANEALAQGDIGAADTVRRLDAAREAIQGQLDAQQAIVDQQQIQLGLASASQAQERTLLNIRKAILEATQKTSKTVADAVAGKVAKEPKAPKGEAPTPEEAAAGGGVGLPTSSVLDQFGAGSIDPQQVLDFATEFAGAENIAEFGANSEALQAQLARIGSVDIGARLKDKFKGLTDIFDPSNPDSVVSKITTFVSDLAGDSSNEKSIAYFFAQIPSKLEAVKDDITARISAALGGIFDPTNEDSIVAKITGFVQNLTGDSGNEDSIAHFFSLLPDNLEAVKNDILTRLSEVFTGIFDPEVEGSVGEKISTLVGNITGDSSIQGSIANFFSQIPANLTSALSDVLTTIQTGLLDPIANSLTSTEPGTLGGIIEGAVQLFRDLPGNIQSALQTLGTTVYGALVVPILNIINSLITTVETGIKNLVEDAIGLVQGIIDGLGVIAPESLKNAVAAIREGAKGIRFDRISTELPDFLKAAPPAATGGLFSKGVVKVGENGPEYITAADKIGVLPAALTRALDGLGSILAAPAPMMVPSGDTYNSSSSSFTFNGVQSDNDARRRYNALRAGIR
jgi:hypothetical protein